MIELKINYDELVDMSIEEAREIISKFDYECDLGDIGETIDGKTYRFKVIEEGKWECDGKWQNQSNIGILCEYDNNEIKTMYNIAVIQNVYRSGSYYTEYEYDYDELLIYKIVKEFMPERVIPAREIITLGDENE